MGYALIIDAEESFAAHISEALQARGMDTRIIADGKAGFTEAQINIPSAIILCVELQGVSGYSICAKLKKDPVLKSVPLIITSAEATQETFEHHKKLKTRAEEYLKKPFVAEELIGLMQSHVQDLQGVEEELPIEDVDDVGAFEVDEPANFDALDAEIQAQSNAGLPPPELSQPAGVLESFDDDDVMTTVGAIIPDPGLAKEVNELKAQLESERSARTKAERDARDATAEVKAAEAKLERLSASQVPSTIGSSREDRGILRKQLRAKDDEISELEDQLRDKKKALRDQENKLVELEEQVVEAEESKDAADHARVEAEGRIAAAEARTEEIQRSSDQTIQDLNQRLNEAASREAELDGALQSSQQDGANLRADNSHKDQEISSLTAEVSRLTNELSASTAESESLRRQLAESQNDAMNLGAARDELEGRLGESTEENNSLRGRLANTEEQLQRALQRVQEDTVAKQKAREALQMATGLLQDAGYGERPDGRASSRPDN